MSAANRLRRLVSRYGLAIAAVLAIVGIAAFVGAVWVFVNPPIETVTEETDVQSVSTDIQTSALVTGNTSLYEQGQWLADMPVYFQRATPVLRLTLETSTPDGVETDVSQELRIEQTATRNGQPFFEANRTLLEATDRVSSGSTTATTDLNTSRIRQDSRQIQNEIGSVGSYQLRLALTVEYQTDQYEGSLSATSPISFTSGAYWISDSLSTGRDHSRTVTRDVTRPADPATYGGLGILGIASLIGAVALYRYRDTIDVASLEREVSHEEYSEWISEGEFPTGTSKRYISINTLEDLVDIAIDSNKRVIYDPSLEVYSVVDGDLVYYFSTDPFNIDVWLDT